MTHSSPLCAEVHPQSPNRVATNRVKIERDATLKTNQLTIYLSNFVHTKIAKSNFRPYLQNKKREKSSSPTKLYLLHDLKRSSSTTERKWGNVVPSLVSRSHSVSASAI
jgi:hypothetical protein